MDGTKTEQLGSEVTPDRESSDAPASKRVRRRLEPSGSDEANFTHDWGRQEGAWPEENKAQLLSESVIEVAMNNNPADDQGLKQEAPATPQPMDENGDIRRVLKGHGASLT